MEQADHPAAAAELAGDELPSSPGLSSPKVRETWGEALGPAGTMGCGEGSALASEGRAAGEGEMGDHRGTSSPLSGVRGTCNGGGTAEQSHLSCLGNFQEFGMIFFPDSYITFSPHLLVPELPDDNFVM